MSADFADGGRPTGVLAAAGQAQAVSRCRYRPAASDTASDSRHRALHDAAVRPVRVSHHIQSARHHTQSTPEYFSLTSHNLSATTPLVAAICLIMSLFC